MVNHDTTSDVQVQREGKIKKEKINKKKKKKDILMCSKIRMIFLIL